MTNREPSLEEFLKDVANHEMTVKHLDGMYRHIRFQQPKNSNMWFELVTWPGYLTLNGDMGCWTFSRVADMFNFFRCKPDKLEINADYWSEKLQHGGQRGRDGAKVWNEELFRSQMMECLSRHDLEGEDLAVVTQALKDDVLSQDGKWDIMLAARDFQCDLPSQPIGRNKKFYFDPTELPSGKEYAYHFMWCLCAIVWGIQQFEEGKS